MRVSPSSPTGQRPAPLGSTLRRRLAALGAVAALALTAGPAAAQVVETKTDPFQYGIPYDRVRLVHSSDVTAEGATAHLRATDPYLLYQLGRDLTQLQFKLEHGAYGNPGSLDVPLYVGGLGRGGVVHGVPARFARDHTASCAMCHSVVPREPASGHTIGSTGGLGRNTPHFFGAGLMEMLGEQIRAEILHRYDTDGDGLIGRDEVAGPRPIEIRPHPQLPALAFGDLAPGPDGVPQLGPSFRIWYVDADGKVLPKATHFGAPKVAGYGFAVQPFGWGRGFVEVDGRMIPQGSESSTLREFFTVASDFHMGMQAHDPTQKGDDPATHGLGGLARTSLSGAQQFDFGGSVDLGKKTAANGLSLDDPDGDGHVSELTEGDVDAAEFFLLHAPVPAVRATERSEAGRDVLYQVGCTRCHVETWRLHARDDEKGYKGDRRLFRFDVASYVDDEGVSQLWGQLVPSHRPSANGGLEPAGEAYDVNRIYTDFLHHDLGPNFHERRFDGSLQKVHRTAPLWGVGSGAPYGHAGNYMSLDEVIRAHAGAAAAETAAYVRLPPAERRKLLDYLRSLTLYSSDDIPADIDGDGEVSGAHMVAEQDVGFERFDARFLFSQPPEYLPLA
ncbi:MAG: di-heme oxidoredictase family protein, partial [Acidobacteriota bacterium]